MTATIVITETGFARADAILAKIENFDPKTMLEGIAQSLVRQTRERIEETKAGPDGQKWPPNSTGTSTLYREGHLARSIRGVVSGNQITIGSGLIYAAIHQFGGTIRAKNAAALAFRIGNAFVRVKSVEMPARPYLGLSADNRSEILEEVAAYIRRLVQ